MKLQQIDDDVNYWVVRAGKQAKYFNHFKENNLVALGHIDKLHSGLGIVRTVDAITLTDTFNTFMHENPELNEVESDTIQTTSVNSAQDSHVPETESQVSAKVTQVCKFVNSMKIGDIVITVNNKSILLGTIKSDAYIDDEVLTLDTPLSAQLRYKLRRNVEWESAKERSTIPKPIKPSLNAYQTLFSISDDNKELFSHWLYGMFVQNNSLFFSTRIDEKGKISQFSLTEFQRAIQKFELLADKISREDYDFSDDLIKTLEEQYVLSGLENDFTLTTKNSFLSPGNMWGQVSGTPMKITIFAMLVGLAHGVNVQATEDVTLSESQIRFINSSVAIIKAQGGGNFDLYKDGIKANLDKPNKSNKIIEPDDLEGKLEIIFPETEAVGDTGV